jgi:hypothetical protein
MQHALQRDLAMVGHGCGNVGDHGLADGDAVVRSSPAMRRGAELVVGGEATEPTPVHVIGRGEAHEAVEEQVASPAGPQPPCLPLRHRR